MADFAGAADSSDVDFEIGDENLQIHSSLKLNQKLMDYEETKLHDKGHYNYFSKQRINKLHPHKPTPKFDSLIMVINNNPSSSWKANECYLQRSHEAYPGEEWCRELVQLDEQEESNHAKGASAVSGQSYVDSWSKKYRSASQIPDAEVPDSFDLRSVMGTDYTSEVRDQA